MNIVIGARDIAGNTSRFHTSVESLAELPAAIDEVKEVLRTTGRRVAAQVVLVGLPGGKK